MAELRDMLLGTPYSEDILRWLPLVQKYFPPEVVPIALQIIAGESGGDPNRPSQYNVGGGEESYGLFQINLQAHPQMKDKVFNPEENVKYASQLWREQGWNPPQISYLVFP